jgi:alpha-tubulin suppressor-like RCC1 family protein
VQGLLADVRVVQVSLGLEHTLARCARGQVYAWGAGWFARLGLGLPTENESEPKLVRGLPAAAAWVAAGAYHSLAVTVDGDLWGWGRLAKDGPGAAAPALLRMGVKAAKVRAAGSPV